MRRIAWTVGVLLLASTVYARLNDRYDARATVKHYPPAHERDTHTVQLNFGKEGIVTILLDTDQPIFRALRHAKKVRVVLEPIDESERLER